jgi:CCR4-NOT transcriptional complex subunit CAF120
MDGKSSIKKSMIPVFPSLCAPSCSVKKHQSLDQTAQHSVPEFRSLELSFAAHSNKVYYSGSLTIRIAMTMDGQKPFNQEWTVVWAQLRGTVLTIWDSKEMEEAAKHGIEVSPSYICINDAVRFASLVLKSSLLTCLPVHRRL